MHANLKNTLLLFVFALFMVGYNPKNKESDKRIRLPMDISRMRIVYQSGAFNLTVVPPHFFSSRSQSRGLDSGTATFYLPAGRG